MPTLKALKARQVLDSRGRPTVEVEAIASTRRVGPGDRALGGQHGPARGARAARRRAIRATAAWASSRPSRT